MLIPALLLVASTLAHAQFPPRPPPDACFRRNDTLQACPYGGRCNPGNRYTCETACMNYQYYDSRFWCNINCGYAATSLTGEIAPNPLLCVQPTSKNGLKCRSGWACYRKFSNKGPVFRTQGPVCSVPYASCTRLGVLNTGTNGTNGTAGQEVQAECGVGEMCVAEPRVGMAKPLKMDIGGICVPYAKKCSGKTWSECGETEECVADASCQGELGKACGGVCVKILGPEWGTYNGTVWTKRSALGTMC